MDQPESMDNSTLRITDRKKRKYARGLVREMVERIGQRPTASRLKVNPGIVAWLIKENDPRLDPVELERVRWTHVTLDELFILRIETAHAYVMDGAKIGAVAMEHAYRALELQSELAKEIRALRRELRKL